VYQFDFPLCSICNIVPVGHNPTKGIKAFRETRRERFLNGEELRRLGDAIREAETVGTPYVVDDTNPKSKHAPKPENRRTLIDEYTASALRILIFTGARLREILHLRWDYVDLERGLLFLPDSKTGRKTIVLNNAATDILRHLTRHGQYVIASTDENQPRADLNKPWKTISRRAKLEGVRLHDLRHTHASIWCGRRPRTSYYW
jgi:integrase